MIVKNILDFKKSETTILEYPFFGYSVYIFLAGFFPSGSIKYSSAVNIIEELETEYPIEKLKESTLVESSSGNFAIALAQICKLKGYKLAIIVDPLVSLRACRYLKVYGVDVIKVSKKDPRHGYLGTRIKKAKELESTGRYIWINQYENLANPEGHYKITAPKLYKEIPNPEYLMLGAGTCGTLTGVSKYFKEMSPSVKVIAIDVEGSVALGGKAKPRRIPGMGTSINPPHLNRDYIDDVIWASERETVPMLGELLKNTGLLFGGSTGTILAGIKKYFIQKNMIPKSVLTISPDFAGNYLDLYIELGVGKNERWVQ